MKALPLIERNADRAMTAVYLTLYVVLLPAFALARLWRRVRR